MSGTTGNLSVSDDETTLSFKSDATSRVTVSDDWQDVKEENDSQEEPKSTSNIQLTELPLVEDATLHITIEQENYQTDSADRSFSYQESDDSTVVSHEQANRFIITGRMVPGSILINDQGEIDDSSIALYEQPKLLVEASSSMDMSGYGDVDQQTRTTDQLHRFPPYSSTKSPPSMGNNEGYDPNKNDEISQLDRHSSSPKPSSDQTNVEKDAGSVSSTITTKTDNTVKVVNLVKSPDTQKVDDSKRDESIRSSPLPLSASQVVVGKEPPKYSRANSNSSMSKDSRIYVNLDEMTFTQPAIPSKPNGVFSWIPAHVPSNSAIVSVSNASESQSYNVHSSEDGSNCWKRRDWEDSSLAPIAHKIPNPSLYQSETKDDTNTLGSTSNNQFEGSQKDISSNNQRTNSISSQPQNEYHMSSSTLGAITATPTIPKILTEIDRQSNPSKWVDTLMSTAKLITPDGSQGQQKKDSFRHSSSQDRLSAFRSSKPSSSLPPLPPGSVSLSGPRDSPRSEIKIRGVTVIGGDWGKYSQSSLESKTSKIPAYYQRIYHDEASNSPRSASAYKPTDGSFNFKGNSPINHVENSDPMPFTIDQNGVLHYQKIEQQYPMATQSSKSRVISTHSYRGSPSTQILEKANLNNIVSASSVISDTGKQTKPAAISNINFLSSDSSKQGLFVITESELTDIQKALSALSRGENTVPVIPSTSTLTKQTVDQRASDYVSINNLPFNDSIIKPEPISWTQQQPKTQNQGSYVSNFVTISPVIPVGQATNFENSNLNSNDLLNQLSKTSSVNRI